MTCRTRPARPTYPMLDPRLEFLRSAAAATVGGPIGFYSQLARLELGEGMLDEAPWREAIAYVDARHDCSDFTVTGLLRLLYRYGDSPMLEARLRRDIESCVLGFKYWWDEPGEDGMCYWTENHQLLFHSCQLLAGQLFPDRLFGNAGCDGRTHVARATLRLRRWFGWRRQFGFSEWLSNAYFDEDLAALLNLYDFAHDPEIRRLAQQFIHLLLFEIGLHSFRGVLASTHGRTYPRMILGGRQEMTSSVAKLALGQGLFNDPTSMSAHSLVGSGYRVPAGLVAVANDSATITARERHGIEVEDAPLHGLRFDDIDAGVFFWGIECFVHPSLRDLSLRMLETYRLYEYGEFKQYIDRYQQQLETHGDIPATSSDPTALTAVDIETHRTAAYQLSCAQAFRAGFGGYQQHIWQATLGLDAVVFTNHPGAEDDYSRPNYWAGNGRLPRALQHRNLLVCLHDVPVDDALPFSHAYFPRAAFDEVVDDGRWLCGRLGDGYVALYSQHPRSQPTSGPHVGVEERVAAPRNAWICELGDASQWGDFTGFVRAVTAVQPRCGDNAVAFRSPSLGNVEMTWDGPLLVAGSAVEPRPYARFENPYVTAEAGAAAMTIRADGELQLDLSDRSEESDESEKARL